MRATQNSARGFDAFDSAPVSTVRPTAAKARTTSGERRIELPPPPPRSLREQMKSQPLPWMHEQPKPLDVHEPGAVRVVATGVRESYPPGARHVESTGRALVGLLVRAALLVTAIATVAFLYYR